MSADKKRFIEGKLSSALHALKYRNFKLFLGGQLVSLIGNYIQTVAQAWLVYRLTGSATLLGLVASGQISIFVLAPISGVFADTKSKRGILFVTQIAPMLLTFYTGAAYAHWSSSGVACLHDRSPAWRN